MFRRSSVRPFVVFLSLSTVALVGCGRDADRDATATAGRTPQAEGEQITATGCLSMNPESRLYVLTTAPDPMAAPVGGLTHTPTTITYQLAGGQGLEEHIGHEVEVTGWADQDAARTAGETEERTDPARNAPTSEGDEPKVETKTETRIRVVPLRVESFRMVSSECTSGEERPEVPNPS